jgi:hypothetical protein
MSVMIGKETPKPIKNTLFAETESLLGLTPRSTTAKIMYDEGLALLNRLYSFQVENHTFFTESLVRGKPTDNSIFPLMDVRQELYSNIRNVWHRPLFRSLLFVTIIAFRKFSLSRFVVISLN